MKSYVETMTLIGHKEGVKYLTDRIDDIVTHKILGLPILMLIAGFTLWAIYAIAGPIGGLNGKYPLSS